jgi:4-cresol dehydrogenase (hydroxylating)
MASLVAGLRDIAGADHAFEAGDPRAAPYRDRFDPIAAPYSAIAAVALPETVEAVQAAVRLANETRHSVWSVPNAAGNGAAIHRTDKPLVLLDLRRMNRILEVDADSAYALIEPGVSFAQLHAHLADPGPGFWVDCDRDARNSVAGSICQRHFGYTPYGEHLLMQCGMEVVLADGRLLRTGMGALPGANTWQLFKYNFGPYVDGLFTQSGLAIVVKIGLWLMPAPPGVMPFMLRLPGIEALAEAVERLRPFKVANIIPNPVAITSAGFDVARGGAARDPQIWHACAALYGPPPAMALTWEPIRAALAALEGIEIALEADRADDLLWQDQQALMRGSPGTVPFPPAAPGAPRFMRLTAAAPMEATHLRRLHEIISAGLAEGGIDTLMECTLTWRTLLAQVHLPYASDSPEAPARARKVALDLAKALTEAGYGIVDESIELRFAFDELYRGTPLAALTERLRGALT